ncbi:hypothetical protein HanPI659440_Chr17g0697311 [Helianthus annuus]|nr:hypothetical protein HanPI659440_Chr17g0697311 [Helianthus annuus]
MERRMNGVKMGRFILKINIAKFAIENNGIMDVDANHSTPAAPGGSETGNQFQHSRPDSNSFRQNGGRSFADLFKDKGKSIDQNRSEVCSVKTINVPDDVRAFHYLYGRALVGRSVDLNSLTKMDRSLWEEGFNGVEIHYVGGLSLLLQFNEPGEATNFLLNQELWKKWFSVLDMWEGQTLPYERVAWLNVAGVPLHLGYNSVFDNIAKEFSLIVQSAQLSIDDGDLSTACVGILVGDEKVINNTVFLKWKNRSFQVWRTDVNDIWVPDCMGIVGSKEEERVENPRSPAPEESPMEVEKVIGIDQPNSLLDEVNNPLREANDNDDGPLVVTPFPSGDERLIGNNIGCLGFDVRNEVENNNRDNFGGSNVGSSP